MIGQVTFFVEPGVGKSHFMDGQGVDKEVYQPGPAVFFDHLIQAGQEELLAIFTSLMVHRAGEILPYQNTKSSRISEANWKEVIARSDGLVYVALRAFARNEHHTHCVCPAWASDSI